MSQYFGKTISLISNKGLRYVGILEDISAEDATVSLKQVRSFGTEGRLAAQGLAHMEVMPGSDIYDYVVFRGNDVQDLTVLDENIEDVKPKPYTGSYASATSGSETGPSSVPAPNADKPVGGVAPAPAAPSGAPSANQASPGQTSQPPAETGAAKAPVEVPATKTSEPAPTTTTERGPAPVGRPEAPVATDDGEFDFEKANARFEKKAATDQKPKYDKSSSFFDSISSSNTERGAMRWSEERSLNMDTFGQEGARGRGGWRGRGRGRGRGGRGGRGRGKPRSEPTPEWA